MVNVQKIPTVYVTQAGMATSAVETCALEVVAACVAEIRSKQCWGNQFKWQHTEFWKHPKRLHATAMWSMQFRMVGLGHAERVFGMPMKRDGLLDITKKHSRFRAFQHAYQQSVKPKKWEKMTWGQKTEGIMKFKETYERPWNWGWLVAIFRESHKTGKNQRGGCWVWVALGFALLLLLLLLRVYLFVWNSALESEVYLFIVF